MRSERDGANTDDLPRKPNAGGSVLVWLRWTGPGTSGAPDLLIALQITPIPEPAP